MKRTHLLAVKITADASIAETIDWVRLRLASNDVSGPFYGLTEKTLRVKPGLTIKRQAILLQTVERVIRARNKFEAALKARKHGDVAAWDLVHAVREALK